MGEEDASDSSGNPYVKAVESRAEAEGAQAVVVCAQLESEIAELEEKIEMPFCPISASPRLAWIG
ncbi:hypothetical protein GCM10025858_18370 [Alicyclobacillus sacchari]|nr:hypothetical protein GCM10025858_18370 [Alicyclobacillus sacchari]